MCMPDLLAVGSRGPSVLPVTGPRQRPERPTVVGVRTRTETRRPTPLQWVRYALGGRLPRELSPWVLADTTEPGWVRRHLTRADRKRTRLNSSHANISYAVFCLKRITLGLPLVHP